jgi:hypothetical protein
LGVGAAVPKDKDGLPKRSEASALDKLRIQLLGKNATKTALATKSSKSDALSSKPRPRELPEAGESDDEEEGRAKTLVSRKGSKITKILNAPSDILDDDTENQDKDETPEMPVLPKKKRASNFMDELLQKKGKKKKKKV